MCVCVCVRVCVCVYTVTFASGVMGIVDLEARPPSYRFAALGQINRVPGQWNPEWQKAEVRKRHSPGSERVHACLSKLRWACRAQPTLACVCVCTRGDLCHCYWQCATVESITPAVGEARSDCVVGSAETAWQPV